MCYGSHALFRALLWGWGSMARPSCPACPPLQCNRRHEIASPQDQRGITQVLILGTSPLITAITPASQTTTQPSSSQDVLPESSWFCLIKYLPIFVAYPSGFTNCNLLIITTTYSKGKIFYRCWSCRNQQKFTCFCSVIQKYKRVINFKKFKNKITQTTMEYMKWNSIQGEGMGSVTLLLKYLFSSR